MAITVWPRWMLKPPSSQGHHWRVTVETPLRLFCRREHRARGAGSVLTVRCGACSVETLPSKPSVKMGKGWFQSCKYGSPNISKSEKTIPQKASWCIIVFLINIWAMLPAVFDLHIGTRPCFHPLHTYIYIYIHTYIYI